VKTLAMAAVLAAMSLQAAYADPVAQGGGGYRTAAPVAFSAVDIARYNFDADTQARIDAHIRAGDTVRVMTPDELASQSAGQGDNTWIIIGVVVLVVVVVAAAGGGGGGLSGGGGGGIY